MRGRRGVSRVTAAVIGASLLALAGCGAQDRTEAREDAAARLLASVPPGLARCLLEHAKEVHGLVFSMVRESPQSKGRTATAEFPSLAPPAAGELEDMSLRWPDGSTLRASTYESAPQARIAASESRAGKPRAYTPVRRGATFARFTSAPSAAQRSFLARCIASGGT